MELPVQDVTWGSIELAMNVLPFYRQRRPRNTKPQGYENPPLNVLKYNASIVVL